jgi:prepilin-type N-terminal cleavage/methylation domain-containing protein
MMRKGFTLIELIFVIVVIGILSVVALPKFTNLKQNAEVSNMVKAYTAIATSGSSAYLNATELNGIDPRDVQIDTLLKISPINPNTGKGWYKRNDYIAEYYIDPYKYMQFYYLRNGTLRITTHIAGTKNQEIKDALNRKLGLIFDGDNNRTVIDLSSE